MLLGMTERYFMIRTREYRATPVSAKWLTFLKILSYRNSRTNYLSPPGSRHKSGKA